MLYFSGMNGFLVLPALFALATANWLMGRAQAPAQAGSHITLLSLNQPPCKVLSAKDVVTAKIAYHIADSEQSANGFAVSIKFQSTDPRATFSVGKRHYGPLPPLPEPVLTLRSDTLTLNYSMSDIMRSPKLQRPVTCYFYLHRNMEKGRSTVIAKTPPIVFTECQ